MTLAFLRPLALAVTGVAGLCAQTPEQMEFFEKNVRPVLATQCQACHNEKVKNGGLDLKSVDGYKYSQSMGFFGNADKPDDSIFLRALLYEDRIKMPPQGKLKPEQLAAMRQWISMGAPWPGGAASGGTRKPGGLSQEDRTYWAFRPVNRPQPPAVQATDWVLSPIDAFLLKKIEQAGLKPPPPASKLLLLRRATFDLTGLPPTSQEIEVFLNDKSANAFEKVVDRLLASPRYGERWGRHWLDVVRYADSTGSDEDHRYPHAWRYRDYVIQSFNQDLPFNQFVREQLAGDLLVNEVGYRGIVATGFLALGKKALAQRDLVLKRYDVVDDQIDVTSKALLGLTVSCARCHDHKFDPILQKDYYGLAGIFASTYSYDDDGVKGPPVETPLAPESEYRSFREKWDAIQKLGDRIDKILDFDKDARQFRNQQNQQMPAYMLAAHEVYSNNADVSAIAASKHLDSALLTKWVAYLRDRSRPELAKWHAASDAGRSRIAEHYSIEFKQSGEIYDRNLNWWIGARKSYPKAGKLVGPRPEVRREDNPFFFHVWLDGGPLHRTPEDQMASLEPARRTELQNLLAERAGLERLAPTKEIPMACAVKEGAPVDQKLFLRGNHEMPGESVPKSFLRVIAGEGPHAEFRGSGRLEFANWVASNDHPLTARVMANRIWQWHFGDGLVRTPDNFGRLGEAPTHPELLDFLAARFMDDGWSIKKLHKLVMLSNAYQMTAEVDQIRKAKDPENRLLSRFPKRRLSIEELRDALLAAGGELDLAMGGTLDSGIGTDGETSASRISMNPDTSNRRSVYLPMRRSNLPTLFNLFDFVDATNPTGKRGSTTVATQALYLMNSAFVDRQASGLASRLLALNGSDADRVEQAFLTALTRKPTAPEKDAALSFISGLEQRWKERFDRKKGWESFCRALFGTNEFIYIY